MAATEAELFSLAESIMDNQQSIIQDLIEKNKEQNNMLVKKNKEIHERNKRIFRLENQLKRAKIQNTKLKQRHTNFIGKLREKFAAIK